jgi:hypothetical protein
MKDLRDTGLHTNPEGNFGPKDVQLFSNAFDRELTRLKAGHNIAGGLPAGGKDRTPPGSPA